MSNQAQTYQSNALKVLETLAEPLEQSSARLATLQSPGAKALSTYLAYCRNGATIPWAQLKPELESLFGNPYLIVASPNSAIYKGILGIKLLIEVLKLVSVSSQERTEFDNWCIAFSQATIDILSRNPPASPHPPTPPSSARRTIEFQSPSSSNGRVPIPPSGSFDLPESSYTRPRQSSAFSTSPSAQASRQHQTDKSRSERETSIEIIDAPRDYVAQESTRTARSEYRSESRSGHARSSKSKERGDERYNTSSSRRKESQARTTQLYH